MAYCADYDDPLIRGEDNIVHEPTMSFLNQSMTLVDLGCGTCKKTIPLSSLVGHVIGIDNNESMLRRALENISYAGANNITLYHGDNLNTPFDSHSIDTCTAFLTTWTPAEVYRILRPEGIFMTEILCADDKLEMKRAFGKDEYGWRGRFLNQTTNERTKLLLLSLDCFFRIIKIEEVKKKTTLSRKGLVKLLEVTPTIRNFSPEKDWSIIEDLTPEGSITLTESRMFIIARPRDKGNDYVSKR